MEAATSPTLKKQRFLELDVARAVLILMLPFVHVYEEMLEFGYASERVIQAGRFLLFLCALGPSGFMLFLGMNVVFSSHSAPRQLARRGCKTLAYFALLNVFRALLPSLVVFLCGYTQELREGVIWALSSDILFFAGCAFLFFALMAKLRATPPQMLLIALGMLTLDAVLPSPKLSSPYLSAFLGNFLYVDEMSCFPLLSWMIFPVLGYCAGRRLQSLDARQERKRFYLRLLVACGACLIALCACMVGYGLDPLAIAATPVNAYQTDLLSVLLDACMVGIWTSIVYLLCALIRSPRILAAANRVSDAILVFYCVQWVLVGWTVYLMMLAGFGETAQMSDAAFVLVSIGVFVASLAIALAVKRGKRKQPAASEVG